MLRATVLRPVVLIVVASLAAGCGGDGGGDGDGDGDAGKATGGRFGLVHDATCVSVALARAGDVAGAQREFDNVHFGLHALVTSAESDDRVAAGELLRATQRVEEERPEPTAAHLADVLEAVRDAIAATGVKKPTNCP